MGEKPEQRPTVDLTLRREEHWTLHHVLLDRLERNQIEEKSTNSNSLVDIREAFESLDAGDTDFTSEQLEAMRSVLAEYHHTTRWAVIERSRLEQLLHHITRALEE